MHLSRQGLSDDSHFAYVPLEILSNWSFMNKLFFQMKYFLRIELFKQNNPADVRKCMWLHELPWTALSYPVVPKSTRVRPQRAHVILSIWLYLRYPVCPLLHGLSNLPCDRPTRGIPHVNHKWFFTYGACPRDDYATWRSPIWLWLTTRLESCHIMTPCRCFDYVDYPRLVTKTHDVSSHNHRICMVIR